MIKVFPVKNNIFWLTKVLQKASSVLPIGINLGKSKH